jgi:hypothetical protein
MTSAINPNNIDGAYPVAGQDNNSQGFRDNFTNTSTNFQYAANEITALQNNSVLTTDLATSTQPVFNNLLASTISNGFLQNMYTPLVALGTLSGAVTMNYALGSFQTLTTSGAITLGFSNFPAAAKVATMALQITIVSTAHTLQLPAAVTVNNAGIQGINTSTNIITFAAVGTYVFQFTTSNGGSTVSVAQANEQITPFNNSSEDLAPSTGASLATTASYFTTAGTEAATLAAGVAGQIKTFSAVDITAGNMVITVTNAGWKSSGTGTITFSTRGSGCTLQYVNSKWFCIGNNGAAFA